MRRSIREALSSTYLLTSSPKLPQPEGAWRLDGPFNLTDANGAPLDNIEIVGEGKLLRTQGYRKVEVDLSGTELAPNERGVLVSPPAVIFRESIGFKSVAVDQQEWRVATLLWDKIALPTNDFAPVPDTEESRLLIQEGLLIRPQVKIIGAWRLSDSIKSTFLRVNEQLQERYDGRWSMARGENSLSILDETDSSTPSIRFEIANVIPVPDKSVHLEKVLEFRLKRKDELSALRKRLEEVCLIIAADPTINYVKTTELKALTAAIEDHLIVAREERKILFRLIGLKPKLLIDSKTKVANLEKGLAAFGAATAVGMPPPISALAGVAWATLANVSIEPGWKGRKRTPSPYEYISSYHNDLFLQS